MADDNEDDSQKTEDPSEKRLRDAIEKGQVIFSKELNHFLIFLSITLSIIALFPFLSKQMFFYLKNFTENVHNINIDQENLYVLFKNIIIKSLLIISLPMLLIMVVAIFSSFVQMGTFILSTEPLSPKLEKLSPLKGLKRLFSMKSFVEFIKGIAKITIVGVAIYMSIKPSMATLNNLYSYDIYGIISILFKLIEEIFIVTCIILAFIAIFDYFYQRFEYYKSLRMSKQDQKEEHKQQEGSPEIKAKLRKIRTERSKRRMIQSVPKADVIITNPTHFSVALQYDATTMRAPILIAKGQDLIALKIREIAEENDIPIVENPPLARSLYSDVEIDQEIPLKFYKAVAEVISYVYKLKRKIL